MESENPLRDALLERWANIVEYEVEIEGTCRTCGDDAWARLNLDDPDIIVGNTSECSCEEQEYSIAIEELKEMDDEEILERINLTIDGDIEDALI